MRSRHLHCAHPSEIYSGFLRLAPNEEANADTVKVDVQIPVDHPIAQFVVQPVPGWTFTVKNVTLAKPIVTGDGSFSQAVSEVIWSGGRVLPGEFQNFQDFCRPDATGRKSGGVQGGPDVFQRRRRPPDAVLRQFY